MFEWRTTAQTDTRPIEPYRCDSDKATSNLEIITFDCQLQSSRFVDVRQRHRSYRAVGFESIAIPFP